jgi:hypothetical protein
MKQIRNSGDFREYSSCAFCGGNAGTKDHCPSKVFLDEPFPPNLPVVPACEDCNNSFAIDEEYTASLIACAISGSVDPELVSRQRIARTLSRKESLRNRISASMIKREGALYFAPENERVERIFTKLAQGHALFELGIPVPYLPDVISVFALSSLSAESRDKFEQIPINSFLPEVGSRSLTRVITGEGVSDGGWIIVQPNLYKYSAQQSSSVEVRIVISEYLGCVVEWNHLN